MTLKQRLTESKPLECSSRSVFLQGKLVSVRIKAVGSYAIAANDDQVWDAKEINTLLRMMNASVGVKGGPE